ncbi:hypothetical protein EIP86_009123 [Pleurotus ostreatoroseus]|nr:hypothetical protein EIP86_009123 [Pleurotus ostreatoroseus]
MTSTVTTTPIEEKVAVLDRKTGPQASTSKDYALKFVCAALSNMAASGVSNPLDMSASSCGRKVGDPAFYRNVYIDAPSFTAPGARANAFWAVGAQMARTEGVLSLMNGMSASMIREIIYSGLRLGSYEYFKDNLYDMTKGALSREGIMLKILAATCAASIGSALANPADVIKGK